ncbi:MAG: SurA N-terminal domain-containing protein, partial [Dehalococcoidia bacterium]
MAKSKSQAQVRVAARRQRTSAPDEEGTNRRLVVGSIALVVIAVIAIIAFGWWWSEIRPFNKTVLQVNNTTFSLDHVVRRMKLEFKTNPSVYQGNARLLSQGVIVQLEREGKLLAGAKKLNNIKVSDKDIDAKIRETGGLAATASPAEFVAELDRQVSDSGLKKDEYLQMLRAQLLDTKVRNYFTFVTPDSEAQTRARWIVVSQESEANDVLTRLNEGEDFAAVAEEVS